MPTISESQLDLLNAKFHRLREAFIQRQIGEATFRVSLEILGLRGQALLAEIQLAKMEQYHG